MRLSTIAALTALFTFSGVASAAPLNACEREMLRAAQQYDVPIGVLYAVGLTETGKKGSLQPFAMNIEGRAQYSPNLADSAASFRGKRASPARC